MVEGVGAFLGVGGAEETHQGFGGFWLFWVLS